MKAEYVKCKNCVFFQEIYAGGERKPGVGLCQRFPPANDFPTVHKTHWCGEFVLTLRTVIPTVSFPLNHPDNILDVRLWDLRGVTGMDYLGDIIGPLEDAGYRTVREVAQLEPDERRAIREIGPKRAEKIYKVLWALGVECYWITYSIEERREKE